MPCYAITLVLLAFQNETMVLQFEMVLDLLERKSLPEGRYYKVCARMVCAYIADGEDRLDKNEHFLEREVLISFTLRFLKEKMKNFVIEG